MKAEDAIREYMEAVISDDDIVGVRCLRHLTDEARGILLPIAREILAGEYADHTPEDIERALAK